MAEERSAKEQNPPRPDAGKRRAPDGSVVRSTDLTAAVSLLGAVVLLNYLGAKLMGVLKAEVEVQLSGTLTANPARTEDLRQYPQMLIQVFVHGVAPLVLGITAVALTITVAQVGFVISTRPLEPDLTKLSPFKGAGQGFSRRGRACGWG